MPYSLRGNKVVKSDTGKVVKDHGDDHDKAVRHLRALKANVEEGLCECGASSRDGLVCQRGHRLVEAWSPEARAAAALARKSRAHDYIYDAQTNDHDAGHADRFRNGGKLDPLTRDRLRRAVDASTPLDTGPKAQAKLDAMRMLQEPGASGSFSGYMGKSAGYGEKPTPYEAFKPRPPQELQQRGR